MSGSYGIFGGRRTNERREIHYAATLDDLVTRASKNCTLAKPEREEAVRRTAEPTPPSAVRAAYRPLPVSPAARLKIHTINFSSSGAEANVTVTLVSGEQEFVRQSSGYLIDGGNALRLVAEATAAAASSALAEEHGIVIDEVFVQAGATGEQIVTVTAGFITPRSPPAAPAAHSSAAATSSEPPPPPSSPPSTARWRTRRGGKRKRRARHKRTL